MIKMATVLDECTIEEQRSVESFFLWPKGLNAKNIHKEMFLVCGGKCSSSNGVPPWWQKFC
jgi:hypothetical protein